MKLTPWTAMGIRRPNTADSSKSRFPYRFRGRTITANKLAMFLKLKGDATANGGPLPVSITPPEGQPVEPAPEFVSDPDFPNGMYHAGIDLSGETMGTWELQVAKTEIAGFPVEVDAIEDILLVHQYGVS